jgi:hypothetical protein
MMEANCTDYSRKCAGHFQLATVGKFIEETDTNVFVEGGEQRSAENDKGRDEESYEDHDPEITLLASDSCVLQIPFYL